MQNAFAENTGSKPWEGLPAQAPMLREKEVRELTGMTRTTLRRYVQEEILPPFIKIGVRTSAMPLNWLNAYIEARGRAALDAVASRRKQKRKCP